MFPHWLYYHQLDISKSPLQPSKTALVKEDHQGGCAVSGAGLVGRGWQYTCRCMRIEPYTYGCETVPWWGEGKGFGLYVWQLFLGNGWFMQQSSLWPSLPSRTLLPDEEQNRHVWLYFTQLCMLEVLTKSGAVLPQHEVLEEEPIHTVEDHRGPVSWRLMVQLQPAGSEMMILKLPVTSLLFLILSLSPGANCGPLPAVNTYYLNLNFWSYSCQWHWSWCPDEFIIRYSNPARGQAHSFLLLVIFITVLVCASCLFDSCPFSEIKVLWQKGSCRQRTPHSPVAETVPPLWRLIWLSVKLNLRF
jgi:hypothetical protein